TIRKSAQCASDRRPKFFCLHQHAGKRSNIGEHGAIRHTLPRFHARFSGPLLAVDLEKFLIDFRMTDAQFNSDTQHGLIQAETGVDADDKKIDGVGNASSNALSPAFDCMVEPEI